MSEKKNIVTTHRGVGGVRKHTHVDMEMIPTVMRKGSLVGIPESITHHRL